MVCSKKRHSGRTGWLGALSFGFFVLLLGVIWMVTPSFSDEVIDFVRHFHLEPLTEHVVLPVPERSHPVVYTAAMQFCLIFGIFQIVLLALRFIVHDSLDRKAGTVSNITFWLSTGFFLNKLASTAIEWFGFLAGLIISTGLAIIVSSLTKLFR